MSQTRVLLADDHTLVLESLERLLQSEFEMVGRVCDGRSLLSTASRLMPDVVVMDISMPMMNGLEAARQLKKTLPNIKIVFLTMHSDRNYVTQAFRAGASAYLLKCSAASELSFAIKEVVKGRYYLTPRVAKEVLHMFLERPRREGKEDRKGGWGGLTRRQREVLQLVAEGNANKEIAEIMKISLKTVEYHKTGIMKRLDLRTTAELTRFALEHGIAGETD